jgi:hypothetical protein
MMNFTEYLAELNNWADHPDISNNPAMRKRAFRRQAQKHSRDNNIKRLPGSNSPAPVPNSPKKLPGTAESPKVPKERPKIKLPKPKPITFDDVHKNRKKGGDLVHSPKGELAKKDDKKKNDTFYDVDRENRYTRKKRDSLANTVFKGPGDVGVAMGRDLEGAPQRKSGI